jgi:hypothetical protein
MTRAQSAAMDGRVAILLLLLVWQNTVLQLGKFDDLLREKMVNIYSYMGILSLV